MKKGILIDMGETIVHNINIDYTKSLDKLYELIINKEQISISKNGFIIQAKEILFEIFNFRNNIEFKMIDYLRLLIDLFNLEFSLTIYELEEVFLFNSCEIKIVDNIEKLFIYFKQKCYPIILVSNTSFSKNLIIKVLGDLYYFFDDIIVSSDYPFRKPNKNIFSIGIKKINLDKNNIYYIGNDFNVDVIGAYNSGINPIWFNENKLNKIEKNSKMIYREINDYSELIDENF